MAKPKKPNGNPLFEVLKAARHQFKPTEIVHLFSNVSEQRVANLSGVLAQYISTNLPAAFEKRRGLSDYRTNPNVLMTTASVMNLDEPARFADFLFNSKLYMALETSFGKSVESAIVGQYPLSAKNKWIEPPEKIAEFSELAGLSREAKARRRTRSVWREIDKSCVCGKRRYLASIKSGPNTINDTQVQAMTSAVIDNHRKWLDETKRTYPAVREIDIVIGLTYGTDRTTNNKDNQILVKLLEHGFVEADRRKQPGVLVDSATNRIRIYRRIGQDFWAFIGNPTRPKQAQFVFLEVLLGLAKALANVVESGPLEDRVNRKIQDLTTALTKLRFPRNSLPEWIREDFDESKLIWFATAMTAFYDEGI